MFEGGAAEEDGEDGEDGENGEDGRHQDAENCE